MGFVDEDKLRKLTESATDALRHIGLTVVQMGYGINPDTNDMMLHIAAVVRETAHEKLVSDEETRQSFNTMMANDAEEKKRQQREEIERALASGNPFGALTSDDEVCSHERKAEGLCLDCGEEDRDLYG